MTNRELINELKKSVQTDEVDVSTLRNNLFHFTAQTLREATNKINISIIQNSGLNAVLCDNLKKIVVSMWEHLGLYESGKVEFDRYTWGNCCDALLQNYSQIS